jgi:predicted nuclease of restriction endonuclease-like RecB superfamily
VLPSDLLLHRYNGEEIVPTRLPINHKNLALADEVIDVFRLFQGKKRLELDEQLSVLEGTETDYRVKRGLAHLLTSGFCTFETVSPLEPVALREKVFSASSNRVPGDETTADVTKKVAESLSRELGREVTPEQVSEGLYADLAENQILVGFEAPAAEALLHRYNLAQVQGVFYRASELVITAHRNDPGEYKLLFRYLKLFGLMTFIEGDADHGYTITIDGPASLFGASTRYGVDLAKFLPALLHVSRWELVSSLTPRTLPDGRETPNRFTLDSSCGLVSHYKKGNVFDSIIEESFAAGWAKAKTEWRLEREVELVPLPGSVMVPDFRLVHPDGKTYVLEIVGYWRPEYLKKKFAQVARSGRDDIILLVSDRLNLDNAGVKVHETPAKVVWFKGKVSPKDVLQVIDVPQTTGGVTR